MKTMSVREIRHSWPEAEKALATEGGVIVTRDSRPVAKIVPFSGETVRPGKPFDSEEHLHWLNKFWKGKSRKPWVDEWIRESRSERTGRPKK